MRLGLFTIVTLNCIIFHYLRHNTVVYLKKSFFSTFLFYWLFFVNLLGLIPKIITFRYFKKLKLDSDKKILRRHMIIIFGKRIYRMNTRFSGISIISHLLSIFVSFKYFFTNAWTVDVDYHLGIYALIFHIRLLYSYYRYRKYFYFEKDRHNKWDLQEHIFDQNLQKKVKNFADLEQCSICWIEYNSGEKLAEFTCEAGHIFHLDCLCSWLERSLTCPLCRVNMYESYSQKANLAAVNELDQQQVQ